ncbi:max-binding protein MNT-like isoform X2 [Neocloeon triangulifer]|uniref:max-binding protein MNT-like isoform X2 n=1 Tax=Neocloeon triangulifer TaxID=2078957 RepID=UPI00286EEB4B|nr:max-binding protein MNT-like isoform X2 [Neocloeon triangulifer]
MMGVLIENEQAWIPPPKKKWIRHYFLSEVPKDYKTFTALQNSGSPPASSSPPRVSLPPPPPPAPHNTPVHAAKVNGVGSSPVGKAAPPSSPPYYHPDGSYLAARLTAPSPASNGGSAAPASDAYIKVKNVPLTLSTAAPLSASPPSAQTPSSAVPNSPSSANSNGNVSPQELKSAGTREVHNKLEKNRRAHLKECFELLRRQLPPCGHDDKKPSNLTVLHSAIRYIQTLKRKERDYEHEMERLAREKISFQQRLSSLKKEISSQYDSVDFAALLPDVPAPSALKASQVHLGSGSLSKPPPFDSDDDFEFEEEDESLRKPLSPPHSASTSTASERGHLSDVEDLSAGNSRPGSSREGDNSPTQTSAPPTPNPNSLRPSAVVEHPGRLGVLTLGDVLRKSTPPSTELAAPPQSQGTKLHLPPHATPIHLSQVSSKQFGEHITRPSHVQLVSSPSGLISTSGSTTLVGPAIQLLAAPSGLRMLTTAPSHDQRTPGRNFFISREETPKAKLGTFIASTESSRLPGGAEINVISSSASQNALLGSAVRSNLSSKPINLSSSASKGHLTNSSAPPILNGGVISHASALHRHTLPQGQNSTTVLSSVPSGAPATMGIPHTVTHHLSPATAFDFSVGITHVVTASGAAHISTLAPLVAAPVTMVAPGSHPSGVHILTTGKPPFQVVSGPLLKHQVLPAQAYLSGQLVKPVMMVSSPAPVVAAPRLPPPSGEAASPNGAATPKSAPS